MGKSLTEMASEIVAAQASHAVMAADEMVAALKKTFDGTAGTSTSYVTGALSVPACGA